MIKQWKKPVKPRLHRRGWTHVHVRLGILLIAVFCGLTLSGCDFLDTFADLLRLNGSKAEAQVDSKTRIETRTIITDTFRIVVDNDGDITPEVVVKEGGFIEFTMLMNSTVRVTLADNTPKTVELAQGDRVLLQTNSSPGVMTIILEN